MFLQSTQPLVIFLGAGASAPFGYPPTKPFVDALIQRIPEIEQQGRLLRSIRETQGVEDAEHIIQVLDVIDVLKTSPLRRFLENSSLTFPRFSNVQYGNFESIAMSLREQVRTEIFRTYSWKPELRGKLDLYKQLFSLFQGPVLEVFTTNYDRVIEEYCKAEPSIDLENGFVADEKRRVWEWNPTTSYKASPQSQRLLRLYKLHGSLNWRSTIDGTIEEVRPEERIGIGGEASYAENLLIYPGGKAEPTSDPFRTLYEAFDQKMRDAAQCLVIGFSFRDEYLNRGFSEFLARENTRLVVVSPSATNNVETNLKIISLPGYRKKKKIIAIDKSFEGPTIRELDQSLKSSAPEEED
jgi:hypothetical protein